MIKKIFALPKTKDPYESKVFKYLNDLSYNSTIILKDLVEKETMTLFIETVKKYCRFHVDIGTAPYMNGIEFNNDYTNLLRKRP